MFEHVCRHVYLSICVYQSSLSGRLVSSGQLQSSICWACIHRAFCIFANLLDLLTFFRLLLSWHFLCEDFSDLLKTLHHIISCTRTSFHLFQSMLYVPCPEQCLTDNSTWWIFVKWSNKFQSGHIIHWKHLFGLTWHLEYKTNLIL